MKEQKQNATLSIVLLLIISLAWGASFIVRHGALQSFSNTQVALFQVFGGAIFFIPFMWKAAKKLTKKNLPILILSGLLGNVLTSVFYALSQSIIDVSIASILSALGPLIVFVEGILLYKQKFSMASLFALLLGLLGVAILIFGDGISIQYHPFAIEFTEGVSFQNTSLLGILYSLLALLSGSSNIILIGFAIPKLTGIEIAAITFMLFSPLAFILLVGQDFTTALNSPTFGYSSWMLALLAFITFVGTVGFNELIKRSSPLFASLATYLILLVGVLFGVFLAGDTFGWKHLLSIICIFIGVYWINRPNNKA